MPRKAVGHVDPCHRHPSYICYGRGCRCPGCRAAHSEYQKGVRERYRAKNPDRRKLGVSGRKPHHATCSEHPSLTCYRAHRCRCATCRAIGKSWREDNETNVLAKRAITAHLNDVEKQKKHRTTLPEAEVIRLRRLVGLNDDGTPRTSRKNETMTW